MPGPLHPTTLLPPPPLPGGRAVGELLDELIGRRVVATPAPTPRPVGRTDLIALYRVETGAVRIAVTCDLAVGASLAAALVVMPPGVVGDCRRAGALEDALRENLYEVFNVLAALFPRHGAPRMILQSLEPARDLDPTIAAALAASGHRVELDLAVAGYGSGRLSLQAI